VVKVTFRLWEEIVIHESTNYSLQDMINLSCIGLQAGGIAAPLQWAEGVAFRFQSMPPTDDIVKELLEGKVHWITIQWALMPEYKQVIPIEQINAKIPIINVSSIANFRDVAKALKEQAQK
jgi:hypothetical protein